jgi:hypothetical protein
MERLVPRNRFHRRQDVSVLIPSSFQAIFCSFACIFTSPSYANFVTLTVGWTLCQGRHTISRVIQASGKRGRDKHHSVFYRFFSRAAWVPDEVGRVLLYLLLPLIPGSEVVLLTDDTLCRRSGPHVWGAGMHHDPLASTYGRGSSRHVAFAFGHSWVVLAVWVPYPWNPERGIGIPILWRLYRSKKRCPAGTYRKRTELAVELIRLAALWIGTTRHVTVVGDTEYACKTVLRGLPEGVDFTGPLPMKAALFDLPPAKAHQRGAPCKKGVRLLTPTEWANDPASRWAKSVLPIYGRKVPALLKTRVCLWYASCKSRRVRVVLTRDPKGHIDDRAYFSTRLDVSPEHLLRGFSFRWALEVTFFNAKQFMGLEDPQNGWGRRPAGCRWRKPRPGPQPRGRRGEQAVHHTTPFVFVAYALVHVWYFQHGQASRDVERAKARAPWYRHKTEPSFLDMLQAARRTLCLEHFSADPCLKRVLPKIAKTLDSLSEGPLAA